MTFRGNRLNVRQVAGWSHGRGDCVPAAGGHCGLATLLLALIASLPLLGAVSGCAIQLSPPYDQAIYNSISDLNVKTETLFAALSQGGTAANFPTYKATYDQLIGGFSAARMSTMSREVPMPSQKLLSITHLDKQCGKDPSGCVNPTPDNLEQIITLLTTMRDRHQAGRLPGEFVTGTAGFKQAYEIRMHQVLVFEAALKR